MKSIAHRFMFKFSRTGSRPLCGHWEREFEQRNVLYLQHNKGQLTIENCKHTFTCLSTISE
jgi:hypothetical protein